MKQFKFLFLIGVGALTLSSCYRSPNESVFYEDLDMVTTHYTETNYLDTSLYLTYIIADSFGVASNVEDVGRDEVNEESFRRAIKGYIRANMNAFGYTELETPHDSIPLDSLREDQIPNIYIPVSVTYINTKGASYVPVYGGYPGWGWGGYPSYGWGGSYYYYPTYVPTYYSYDQGSLHINFMDISTAKQFQDTIWEVNTTWDMTVSGLMRSASGDERNARLKVAIDQGFKQSPYLDHNQ